MKKNIFAVFFIFALVALRYLLVTRVDLTPNAVLWLHLAAAVLLCAAFFLLRYLMRKRPEPFERLRETIARFL